MKETLTTYEIADRLARDEYAGFSWDGARALAEYLEQMEEDTGVEMEFDRVAIRCDFSEYESAIIAAEEYGFVADDDDDDDEREESAKAFLSDHTTIIPFSGGIIVQAY